MGRLLLFNRSSCISIVLTSRAFTEWPWVYLLHPSERGEPFSVSPSLCVSLSLSLSCLFLMLSLPLAFFSSLISHLSLHAYYLVIQLLCGEAFEVYISLSQGTAWHGDLESSSVQASITLCIIRSFGVLDKIWLLPGRDGRVDARDYYHQIPAPGPRLGMYPGAVRLTG